MFLEWGNTTVNIEQTISRGISIGIGTPQQVLALRPSSTDNDLYVVNVQACQPSYNETCSAELGGTFDCTASTSYVEVTQAQWNGTSEANPNNLSFIYFYDDLSFGNAIVDNFPAFMDQVGYGDSRHTSLPYMSANHSTRGPRYFSAWI